MARIELSIAVNEDGTASTSMTVHAPNVTGREVARHLLNIAAQVLGADRLPTRAEVIELQRQAQVVKDYPGVKYHPGTKAFLCPACVDLVADGGLLDGEVIDTPTINGSPLPGCTYHLANQWPGGLTLDQLSERRAAQTPEEDA